MYIWIHDKYSSTSFKQRLWQRKIVFMWQNYFFKPCVSLWCSGQEVVLNVQINRVRLPATLFSVSLYRFFFSVWSLFFTLFFLLAFFSLFLLLTLLVMHLDQCYFKLKSGVLFWKRDFKSSWSAYWPSLRPDKNHKPCQDMSLLWNS